MEKEARTIIKDLLVIWVHLRWGMNNQMTKIVIKGVYPPLSSHLPFKGHSPDSVVPVYLTVKADARDQIHLGEQERNK